MMMTLRQSRIAAGESERGFALIMVIAIAAVLMILATVAVTYSISGAQKAKKDQGWNAALSAAYAGIDEYQSRLSNDTSYTQYGNPAAAFSTGSTVALPTGTQANPAFGTGTSGTWATISGSGGAAKYRYEVDNSKYSSTGILRVRATGLASGETRTVIADLKQKGFIDFLYFTDYEIQDPELSGASPNCVKYKWAGRSGTCGEIQFGRSDTINGPLHSNDTMLICGSTFKGAVTTGNSTPISGSRLYNIPGGCGSATFTAGAMTYAPVVGMPSTNSQMKREARSDLTLLGVPNPGCLYTGPTSIVFNAGGTMIVRSPWTKATNVAGDPASSGSVASGCGTLAQLRSLAGATVATPDRNVIYVQNVPAEPTDPNYWGPSMPTTTGYTYACKGASGSGAGNGIGYPMNNESAPARPTTPYGCTNGDVFVKGSVNGKVTIASENYVYIIGDIKYNDSSADMLGLVGNNAVWVWNPVNGNSSLLGNNGRRIDAAILSVAHTFQVQNYATWGYRGILTINGAIAQKFRGPVGTTSPTGYSKNYVYDARFKYTAPPKFLSPVTTTYGVSTWMDTAAAFNVDGSYR